MPCARTTATAGRPAAAATMMTTTTTRMILQAAMWVKREGRTPRPPLLERPLQREDEHGRAGGEVLHFRPERGVETQHEGAETARHRDVLLPVDRVADGTAAVAGAGAEVPERLAGVGVVRVHDAFDIPVDDEAAAGREHAADGRILEVDRPLPLTRDRVTSVEVAVGLAARWMLGDLIAAEEEAGSGLGLRRLLLDGDLLAGLHRGVVPELRLRTVRARVPAATARDPGADELRLADLARRVATDELTGFGVDALHPVVDVVHRPHVLDLAVRAVVHEHETALVLVDEQFLAVAIQYETLAEARVVVPVVVRDLLVVPLELAVVRVEGEHRRRVEVVTGPRTAPIIIRRGVCRAPVDEVQRRIVGAGHPAAAAAELPGVTAPALRIFLDRVELPHLVSGGGLEAEDLSLDRQLARRLSDDDLVLDGQRRAGEVAAALLRLEDLLLPDDLSSLLVERDHAPVQAAEIDAPVRDREAAVVGLEEQRVHHRIELRVEVPDFLARRRIEREDAIVGGDVVHDPVDHERSGFQTLDNRARLMNPGHGKILDVVLVDLGERTVAGRIVAGVIHRVVVGVVVLQPAQTLRLPRGERRRNEEQHQHAQKRGATDGLPLPHKVLSSRLDPEHDARPPAHSGIRSTPPGTTLSSSPAA